MTTVPQDAWGQVVAAAALRAKWSRKGPDGKPLKQKVRIEHIGVHPKNRGGVYPAGLRCRSLALDVLDVGVSKEALSHQMMVVVEETQIEEIRSRGDE